MYLALLPTFTTNSINIIAGVNGVEAIQPLIIALSVTLNDLLFLPIWPAWLLNGLGVGNADEGRLLAWAAGEVVKRHLMSLYFMIPLVGACAGFLWHNWWVLERYKLSVGTLRGLSQATLSVTLQGWHFLRSQSKVTSPRLCCCSSPRRSSTSSSPARSCSVWSSARDTGCLSELTFYTADTELRCIYKPAPTVARDIRNAPTIQDQSLSRGARVLWPDED